MKIRVAVVGAGLVGLAAVAGYRFDTERSLFIMPFVFHTLFEEAGQKLADHFTLVPREPL